MCSQLGNFGSCLSEPNTIIKRATVHMVISICELNCAFEVDLGSVMASVYVIQHFERIKAMSASSCPTEVSWRI